MKRFLKGFGIFFFGAGVITYTALIFTEGADIRPPLIVMDVIFIICFLLLFRKKKPRHTAPKTQPAMQPRTNLDRQRAVQSMKGAYSVQQGKEHIRILKDCLNLIEKTKNLETFFSRSEYGMTIALTLQQGRDAGILPGDLNLADTFFQAAYSQRDRVLAESFWEQKNKIANLSKSSTKAAHWKRYLELLEKYEDQYDLELRDDFESIQDQVLTELSKCENE